MPARDKTGPEGKGPRTGRGLGSCRGGQTRGGRAVGRPRRIRRVRREPDFSLFKPAGVPASTLKYETLTVEEYEAIKLTDVEGKNQDASALKMGVSQPTFSRLIESGRRKLAGAIVEGKAIKIEGGAYEVSS